ncbi:hypothetical protein ACGCUQ_04730 [Eubacteriales bacterium KG127]
MERDKLIEEILKGVLEKLGAMDKGTPLSTCMKNEDVSNKPILLITSDKEKLIVDEFLDNDFLESNCHLTIGNDNFNFTGICQGVILELNNLELSKLSSGFCDSEKLKLIEDLIQSGKEIYLVKEGIEFLKYEGISPTNFLRMYKQKLNVLRSWKIKILSKTDIKKELKKKYQGGLIFSSLGQDGKMLTGKFITQRDLEGAYLQGRRQILISKQSKMTDVASEYAERMNIIIKKL